MEITCPRCKKIHTLQKKANTPLKFSCDCEEEIVVDASSHRRRVPLKRKLIQCSRCNRIYDPREILDGKKICTTCGNLIVKEGGMPALSGKREDRQVAYARSETQALLSMCKLMSSSFDRDVILAEVMRITTGLLRAEGSSIILLAEEKDEMIFHITTGEKSEDLKKIKLKLGEGIAGHVFRTRTPLIVNNTRKDPRFCNKVDSSIKFITRNLICVPIFVGERIIGVLESVNKKEGFFDDYDLKILEAIASQAGLAIEKSELIQENIKSERLAAIGQTVSNLSFCIKNILTNLEGWAYNVDRAIQEKDYDNLLKGWEMMNRSVARISDLVSDMLLFSSENKRVLYPTNINLMIEEIRELIKERAFEKQVKIITHFDKSMKCVPLNARDLYRCILNIVINAIEACAKGKGLVEIHSTMNHRDNTIFVEIVDNGEGISPEQQDKIFNVFFTTKGLNHSGLGLPIARKIVEEHGGGIVVESQKGKGSRIMVKIPFDENAESFDHSAMVK